MRSRATRCSRTRSRASRLDPEVVDCVMFCSKDYAPILPRLHEITDRFNTCFHYTITAYGKDVEPGVPPIEEAIDTLKRLSAQVGKGRVAWRYDPVLLTETYTVERHLETFEAMAAELAPHVDRCVFSFVEMYRKARDEHAGARAADGGRQGRARQGHGRDGRAMRPVPARPAARMATIPATASIRRGA